MHAFKMKEFAILLMILGSSHIGMSKVINFSLKGLLPTADNSEIHSEILSYNDWGPSSMFQFNWISPKINFLIIQVHTKYDNIIMSYDEDLTVDNHVNGTNIGLIFYPKERKHIYLINNGYNEMFDIYFSINAYYSKAPIPGGCNMEFNVIEAPYLKAYANSDTISVDAAPPKSYKVNKCNVVQRNVSVDFYHLHYVDSNVSSRNYIYQIQNMITVSKIKKYGTKVSDIYSYSEMRRIFAMYPDVGSVYAVIVTDGDYSSAYVPIHTYGCSVKTTCPIPDYWNTASYVAAAFGVLISLFGHSLFITHILVIGFLLSSLLTYSLLSAETNFHPSVIFHITMALGTIGALGYYMLWRCTLQPAVILLINSLTFGCFMMAFLYFLLPDYTPYIELGMSFWWSLVTLIAMALLISLFIRHYSVILTCGVIGSFLIIIPVDVANESHFRYIIVNFIRRMSVKNFEYAVVSPPLLSKAIYTGFVWVPLAIIFMIIHCCVAKNNRAFPVPLRFEELFKFVFQPFRAWRLSRRRRQERNPVTQQNYPYYNEHTSLLHPNNAPNVNTSQYSPTAPPAYTMGGYTT